LRAENASKYICGSGPQDRAPKPLVGFEGGKGKGQRGEGEERVRKEGNVEGGEKSERKRTGRSNLPKQKILATALPSLPKTG